MGDVVTVTQPAERMGVLDGLGKDGRAVRVELVRYLTELVHTVNTAQNHCVNLSPKNIGKLYVVLVDWRFYTDDNALSGLKVVLMPAASHWSRMVLPGATAVTEVRTIETGGGTQGGASGAGRMHGLGRMADPSGDANVFLKQQDTTSTANDGSTVDWLFAWAERPFMLPRWPRYDSLI